MSERQWIRPDAPKICPWMKGGDKVKDCSVCQGCTTVRHTRDPKGAIPNVLHAIGQTPMVKLSKIAAKHGLECDLYAKCEYFNAGGSIKDRIALRMVEELERKGEITPGVSTLIEPTSGNTGVGLALAAAVKGYRCIICMPYKMSQEKENVLRALGAEIVRTPNDAGFEEERSHIGQAWRLVHEIPGAIIPDQYRNPGNPLAHYDETGVEILEQAGGHLDMLVAGAGTGGTITGIGRRIKENCPDCEIIGVDPYGSILAQPEALNQSETQKMVEKQGYEIEGTGYDFYPTVLSHDYVDKWHKSLDRDGLPMARELIRLEGLLCGGSSGATVHAAIQEAKKLKKGQKCVVVLADSIRNYMTKHLKPGWCVERSLIPDFAPEGCSEWWFNSVSDVKCNNPNLELDCETSLNDAIAQMRKSNVKNAFITENGKRVSVLATTTIINRYRSGRVKKAENPKISSFMDEKWRPLTKDQHVGLAMRILEANPCAILADTEGNFVSLIEEDDVMEYCSK